MLRMITEFKLLLMVLLVIITFDSVTVEQKYAIVKRKISVWISLTKSVDEHICLTESA